MAITNLPSTSQAKATLIALLVLIIILIFAFIALLVKIIRRKRDSLPSSIYSNEKPLVITVHKSLRQTHVSLLPAFSRASPWTLAGCMQAIEFTGFKGDPIKFIHASQRVLGDTFWVEICGERVLILCAFGARIPFTAARSNILKPFLPWSNFYHDFDTSIVCSRGLEENSKQFEHVIMTEADSTFTFAMQHNEIDLITLISSLTMRTLLNCVLGEDIYAQRGIEMMSLLSAIQEEIIGKEDTEKMIYYKERISIIMNQILDHPKGLNTSFFEKNTFDSLSLVSLILCIQHRLTSTIIWMILHILHDNITHATITKEINVDPQKSHIPFLDLCYVETLRMHSPALYIKIVKGHFSYRGSIFPRGSKIAISPYIVNMNQQLYPSPEKFDPFRHAGSMHSTFSSSVGTPPLSTPPPALVRRTAERTVHNDTASSYSSVISTEPHSSQTSRSSSLSDTYDFPLRVSLVTSLQNLSEKDNVLSTSVAHYKVWTTQSSSTIIVDEPLHMFSTRFANIVTTSLFKNYNVGIQSSENIFKQVFSGKQGLFLPWPVGRPKINLGRKG